MAWKNFHIFSTTYNTNVIEFWGIFLLNDHVMKLIKIEFLQFCKNKFLQLSELFIYCVKYSTTMLIADIYHIQL